MQGEQMEQALKDDAAQKAAAGAVQDTSPLAPDLAVKLEAQRQRFATRDEVPAAPAAAIPEAPAPEPVEQQVEIGFNVVAAQLDTKNALMAKTVCMALADVARIFIALSVQTRPGKEGREMLPPDAATAEKCLGVAERALKLAELAARLGDKSAALVPDLILRATA